MSKHDLYIGVFTERAHAATACERMMSLRLDYRRHLLAIVEAFLDPTDPAHKHARRLVEQLYHDPRRTSQTLDDLVWGGFVSELTDSLFFERADYLHAIRGTLLHGSPELHRAYLNYDFRPNFTEVEQMWHNRLVELAAWLKTSRLDDYESAQAEYELRVEEVTALGSHTPPPRHIGEETLYHLILRTASAVLTEVNLCYSKRLGYLAADVPFTEFHWDPHDSSDRFRPPNAAPSVAWAERALRAIMLGGLGLDDVAVTCHGPCYFPALDAPPCSPQMPFFRHSLSS